MLNVMLDRSVFHGDKYKKLTDSNLLRLSRSNNILIYGNPMLIEETYGLQYTKHSDVLGQQMQYILRITNERWFRGIFDLCSYELAQNNHKYKYWYVPCAEQKHLSSQIYKLLINGKMDQSGIESIKYQKDLIDQKGAALRKTCLKMRSAIAEKISEQNKQHRDLKKSYTFDVYLKGQMESFGEAIIDKHIEIDEDKCEVKRRWVKRMNYYPYFTDWVKGLLYIPFHAMLYHDAKVDENAQDDMCQLMYMKDLDIFVSDDNRFQKDAFNQFYASTKRHMNLNDFLSLIATM
jgi:hypothetical protein